MAEYTIHSSHCSVRFMFEAMINAAGFISDDSSPDLSPIRKRSVSPEGRKGEVEILPYERFKGSNYSQIADKNARELIKQEEEARLKAEKKKAKKERQKKKKKELSEDDIKNKNIKEKDNSINSIIKNTEHLDLSTDNKEAESFDVNAAFVTKAVKKVKHITVIPEESKSNSKNDDKHINSLIKTAVDLGNKLHYKEALQHLSEAINLAPKRFDLILKRSFIYYQLAKFEKSIRDAQKALQFSPNNIDGYYRLGEGHFAMNNLSEAEDAFTKLLSFNAYTDEANERLFSIRVKQLEEMGYHPNEAFTALIKSKNRTLDEAIEFLTALEKGKQDTEDLYYSDDEESEEDYEDEEEEEGANGPSSEPPVKQSLVIDNKSPLLTDPSNPLQCCSLFVGNLKNDVTYKEVEDVFIKFGNIKTIKLATETTNYGFVNFEESSSAGRAMEALKGSRWLLSTVPLLVRYPTNVINNILSTTNNTELLSKLNALQSTKPTFQMKKPAVTNSTDKTAIPDKSSNGVPVTQKPDRPRPPPKTVDCYFWTTTGCIYGTKCFNLHRPECKGVALNSNRPIPQK